jgi:hypothetical protein
MSICSDDRSYWRERAAKTRVLAEKTYDPATREDLLAIAATCECLATLAEQGPQSDEQPRAALRKTG